MSPDGAFVNEAPYLIALPEALPPIYESYQRLVDVSGYIHLETNHYSAPEKYIGKSFDIYKYLDSVEMYYQHQKIAVHKRLIGKRYGRSTIKGHHRKGSGLH